MHWILDGYNVLYAINLMGGRNSLEITRHKLIAISEKFQSTKNVFLTIVFDGVESERPESYSSVERGNFRIIFSNGQRNADGVILQCLTKNNEKVTVVTADMLLRDAVIRKGGNVMSPENFYREFSDLEKHSDHIIGRVQASVQKGFNCPFKDFL